MDKIKILYLLCEEIIPKALRLLDKVQLIGVTPFSAVAKVPSESSSNWGEFRARPCKHVVATVLHIFKDILNLSPDKIVKRDYYILYGDYKHYTLLTVIHEALNKSAYLRVKLGEISKNF